MALTLNQLPVIKRGWMRAALFCIAYITCLVLTGVIIGMVYGVAILLKKKPAEPAIDNPTLTLTLLFVTSIISLVLVWVFRRFIDRRPIMSLGFSITNFKQDAWAGFLLAPALLGAGSLILFFNHNLQWTDATFHGSDLFMALVLMLLLAVAEEAVFRGYVLNNLMESINKWAALAISAVLFTIAHASNPNINILSLVNLLLGGLLLGINYIYTRNLWFAILFHFSWNFFQGPLLGYDVSGINLQSVLQQEVSGNPLLTGGLFGFEGSVVCTILSAITLLLLYLVYETRMYGTKANRHPA
jgi:uncharacterized protein